MSDSVIVFGKILEMVGIIAAGWAARRAAYLTEESASGLSRVVVDLAFPCLVFTQLLRTVDPEALSRDWYLPLLGAGIILGSALLGLATAPLFARPGRQATYVFLAATPNWVFLPLPIAEALFGDPGVTVILLCSVGAQLSLWTVGVAILRGRAPDRRAWRRLLTSPGLLATLAGLALAWQAPAARDLLAAEPAGHGLLFQTLTPLLKAAASFGGITIPVSLLLIGAAMGGLKAGSDTHGRELAGLALARLILPLPAAVLVFRLAALAGWEAPGMIRSLAYLVACMPVAISSSVMAERYGGDCPLAARAIFVTSLLSIATVPLLVLLTARLGL
jgi:hypothetical protein